MDEEELLQQYHGNNPFSFGSRREVKRFVNIDDGELKNVLSKSNIYVMVHLHNWLLCIITGFYT